MAIFSKLRMLFEGKSQEAVHPLERTGLLKLHSYASPIEGDQKVLQELVSHGADLSRSRHVVHYLYFAQPDDRERAFEELEAHGYEVHPGGTFEETDRPYSLLAERVGVVNEDKISEERDFLSSVAGRLNGAYDGWEAALD